MRSSSARSSFSLLLSGSFFVDRVSRDENRIAVCGSNKNRRVVKCQPQSAATRVTRQGKHESKKEKRSVFSLDCCRLSTTFWGRGEGREEFSRLDTLPIFVILISRRLNRENFLFLRGKIRNQKSGNKIVEREGSIDSRNYALKMKRLDRWNRIFLAIRGEIKLFSQFRSAFGAMFSMFSRRDGAFLVIFSPFHQHPRW